MIDYECKPELFFQTLQTKDVTTRKGFLEELEKEFETDDRNGFNENNNSCNGVNDDNSAYYPIILRFAHECPFEDVRHTCSEILVKLEVYNFWLAMDR